MSFLRSWTLIPALTLLGCFSPSTPEQYYCSADAPTCPSGLVCAGTLCVPEGTKLDAAPPDLAPDMAQPDTQLNLPAAMVGLLAGTGSEGAANGPADQATFFAPLDVAVGADGTVYVADTNNGCLRAIKDGSVTTLAGPCDPDPGKSAFNRPEGVAVTPAGDILVADTLNNCVRQVSSDGTTVTTVAGKCGEPGSYELQANPLESRFNGPTDVVLLPSGEALIVDSANHCLRKLNLNASSNSVLAGKCTEAGDDDGNGQAARFRTPKSAALTTDGNILVAEWIVPDVSSAAGRLRQITNNAVTTLTGSSIQGEATSPLADATFRGLTGMVQTAFGVLLTDSFNHTLRLLETDAIPVVGGTVGTPGSDNDKLAQARFHAPRGMALAPDGRIVIADTANHMIRVITP